MVCSILPRLVFGLNDVCADGLAKHGGWKLARTRPTLYGYLWLEGYQLHQLINRE